MIIDNSIYIDIAEEYIEELELPGKALVILEEASQRRGIHGLTDIAMIAVKSSFKKAFKINKDQDFTI